MEILTTNVKLPIFFTENNIFITKKRNLSLSNQSSINTSSSPNKKYKQSEIFIDNEKPFKNIKSNTNEPIIKKGKWSQEEDNLLKKYVNKFGEGNWSKIERFFIGRTRKQIRQRYISNIKIKKVSEDINEKIPMDSCSSSDEEENEDIKKYENKNIFKWDEELDKLLLKEYFLSKKSWVKISKKIPGSSENSVKNRFYSLLRQKVNKIKKEYKYKYMNNCNSRNYENNNLILLINKEIYGNKKINNYEDKKELLFNKLYLESEYCNNKSKKRNYSVEILLEFLPELLEDKGINIYEILDELKQRKHHAAKQIFIFVEKLLNYKNSENQDCNSISTDIEFDNLKNLQSEKLGIVIKNMKLKIMYKYFQRFRYNTLGI